METVLTVALNVVSTEEVSMVPESPTTTSVSFANEIPLRTSCEPEVRWIHVAPSAELRMVPSSPTATKRLFE
jgi:hypothetical protein